MKKSVGLYLLSRLCELRRDIKRVSPRKTYSASIYLKRPSDKLVCNHDFANAG